MTESEVYLKRKIHELESKVMENPKSDAIFDLATLYKDNDNITKALEYCVFGLRKIPDSHKGFVLLGDIFLTMKNHPKAERAYANAFKLKPSDPEPLFRMSDIYIESEDIKKLNTIYQKLESTVPLDKRMPILEDAVHQLRKKTADNPLTVHKNINPAPNRKENVTDSNHYPEKIKTPEQQRTVNISQHLIVDEHIPSPTKEKATVEESRLNLIARPVISFESLVKKIFEIEGIIGMVYMNNRGEISRSMDCDIEIAKVLAIILKSYAKAFDVGFRVLKFGKWQESIIILEDGFVFLLDVNDYKLVFNCSNEITLGNLRARIKSILQESGFINA